MNGTRNPSAFARVLPWAVASIAILALAVVLIRQRSATPDAGGTAEIARLEERLAALEQQRSSPGDDLKASSLRDRYAARRLVPGGSELPENLRRGPHAERTSTPAEQQAERKAFEQRLQAQFAADPADAGGGAAARTHLEEAVVGRDMASTGLVPDDLSVECRTTLCRVSADFAKPGDAEDWAMMYLSAAGGAISRARTVQVPRPDGTTRVIIYGVRGDSGR